MIKKTIDATLIFHVIRFSETLKKQAEKVILQEKITTQQWFILLLLAKDPNIFYLQEHKHEKHMMAKELAEALNVSRANITNLLNVLIEKKLIVQYADETDKRRKRLKLTQEGERIIMKLEPDRSIHNAKLFAKFSLAEKNAFIHFVKTCLQIMKPVKQ